MATTYSCTMEGSCWKQHTCVGCGSVFRYLFSRKVVGQASTEQQAETNAKQLLEKAMIGDFDLHPCPHCGVLQPEMLGVRRARWHRGANWIALLTLGVLLVLTVAEVLNYHWGVWLMAPAALIVLAVHLIPLFQDPNRDQNANLAVAGASVREGKLMLDQQGTADNLGARSVGQLRPAHKLALCLLAVGVLGMGLAELVRVGAGWPLNADWRPGVVGPGDTACLWYPNSPSSIKGYWTGTPSVKVVSAGDAKVLDSELRTETRRDSWGSSIYAKSSEKSSSFTPWQKVTIPERPELAGQTLKLTLGLGLSYPAMRGSGFTNASQTLAHSSQIQLASPGAGGTYVAVFWWGSLLGTLLFLLAGWRLVSLAKGMVKWGNPATMIRLEQPAAPAADTSAEGGEPKAEEPPAGSGAP